MYLPGYYEDVDLCFRGWKRGWIGRYVPASRKFHQGGASFSKKYSRAQIQTMVHRNAMLFMVKNISDPLIFAAFIFLLPFRLLFFLITGRVFYIHAFRNALSKLPEALAGRKSARSLSHLSDREIFNRFKVMA
jgi:GT2 family glycosyltransferase